MPVCVPIKELKNTQRFSDLVADADGPVIVTKNGRETFVSMSMDEYEALRLEAARAELYRSLDRAESDIASGRFEDAHGFLSTLERRDG